jgi:hypothetical protein
MTDLDLLLCPAISNAAANIFLTASYLWASFVDSSVFISGYVGLLLDQGQQKLHG